MHISNCAANDAKKAKKRTHKARFETVRAVRDAIKPGAFKPFTGGLKNRIARGSSLRSMTWIMTSANMVGDGSFKQCTNARRRLRRRVAESIF